MHKTQILYPEARGNVSCQHAIPSLSHQCPELTEQPCSCSTEGRKKILLSNALGEQRPWVNKVLKCLLSSTLRIRNIKHTLNSKYLHNIYQPQG